MAVGLVVMAIAGFSLIAKEPPAAAPLTQATAPTALPSPGLPSVSASPSTAHPSVKSGTTLSPLRLRAGSPNRLVIGSLGVRAPVVPIDMSDGILTPPADPTMLGWWSAGARPGAKRGTALVTGHTVHTGGGALDNLEELSPGDRMVVTTDAGRTPYVVRDVAIYRKKSLARDAASLFAQDGPGRLVVVTCEDWDGTAYLSNVVVIAVPAGNTR